MGKTLGQRLRELRKAKGLSLRELAGRVDVGIGLQRVHADTVEVRRAAGVLLEPVADRSLALAAGRNNRGFVANVGNIGPGEPGSL